jgi:esterase
MTVGKILSREFQIFLVDQRNHGKSFHSESMTYLEMAQDVDQLMTKNQLKTASIIGHSMGGKTAMQFSFLYPARVEKLVIVDISPKTYNYDWIKYIRIMREVDLSRIHNMRNLNKYLSSLIPDNSFRNFLMLNLGRTPKGSYFWKPNLETIENSYTNIAAPVKGPPFYGDTLFIRGQLSSHVKDADRLCIEKLFPSARFATISESGHWVHIDRPKQFIKTVTEFLTNDAQFKNL